MKNIKVRWKNHYKNRAQKFWFLGKRANNVTFRFWNSFTQTPVSSPSYILQIWNTSFSNSSVFLKQVKLLAYQTPNLTQETVRSFGEGESKQPAQQFCKSCCQLVPATALWEKGNKRLITLLSWYARRRKFIPVSPQNILYIYSKYSNSFYVYFFFFFFNRHCNPCGFWPAQLSLSILSRKVFTECRCQWHV